MNTRSLRLVSLFAAVALVVAACGSDSSTTSNPSTSTSDTTVNPADPSDPVDLAGTRWVADTLILGGAVVPIVPLAEPTIDFTEDGRGFGGTTGCNSYGGEYTVAGNTIQFGAMNQTEMACEEPLMRQERDVLTVLQSATAFTLQDGVLTIGDITGSALQFIDRAVAFPDAELTSTQWVADTLLMGDTASSMDAANPVTLFIDSTASEATGSTGCNDYTASVEPSRTQLTFGQMSVTERGCVEAGVMETEQFVLALFQGELQVDIDGDRLTLRGPDGNGLSFTAAP
jgi:heat shock protein HslJ